MTNQSNTSRGLTEADQKFLAALKPDGSPTGSWNIPSATREQDAARTRARKNGWAIFDRKNWAWRITDAGRAALQERFYDHREEQSDGWGAGRV